MNLSMFRRAIDRHRHMQLFSPYREFLQHVVSQSDLWSVSQAEFAQWWASRDRASLDFVFDAQPRVTVRADLEGAVLEIGDGELRALPQSLECGPSAFRPSLSVPASQVELTRTILKHLGQAHVEVRTGPDEGTTVFSRLLHDYLEAGVVEARAYPVSVIDALRDATRDAHRQAGLPPLRLWTLPRDAAGRPYRVAYSPRFDVDKAMVNVAMISELHAKFGIRGTFYVRPMGVFYGQPEIQRWAPRILEDEIALHGEFVTTAEQRFGDEVEAAKGEKRILEEWIGAEAVGVCTHGGELRTNQTANTPRATDEAGFLYETTFYPRSYFLPMFLPCPTGIRTTLTMLRHQDDVSLPLDSSFGLALQDTFSRQLGEARAMGGVFVPTMHPLYFDLKNYLSYASSWARLATFAPVFFARAVRMKRGQLWSNQATLRQRG